MQRYFGEVLEGRVILSENDVFHLVKVMRCKIGTEIEIVSDGRVFLARVEQVKPLLIKVLKSIKENTELPSDIVLILAALKGDKNDIVLQKATELGVREIDIFFSERTIVKLKPSECDGKLSRYRRIVKEASEQSRRSRIPLVSFLTSFND
ncbi:MAG: RsmE family RNA methyltransferase, partial [Bacilli bacterium]